MRGTERAFSARTVPRLRSLVPVRLVSKRRPATLMELAIEEARYAYREIHSWRCREDVFVRDSRSGVEVVLSRRFLASGDAYVAVSFCGTEKWLDWVCNMTMFLSRVVEDSKRVDACADTGSTDTRDPVAGRAHAGFLSRWRSIRSKLVAALPRVCSKDARLVITGHSLGGAIAALAAPDIALSMPHTPVSLITFGAPMFADARYNGRSPPQNLRTSIRCVHVGDVVQYLPPLPFYTHPRFGTTAILGERSVRRFAGRGRDLAKRGFCLGFVDAITRCFHERSESVRSHEILCYWSAIAENDVRYLRDRSSEEP